MSNKLIMLWGFVIVLLVSLVYFIGIRYEDEIKYVNLKSDVKEAVKKYVEENDVSLPFSITTETLEEEGYIDELKLNEKVCAADVIVKKKFLFYSFDIKFTCINVEN